MTCIHVNSMRPLNCRAAEGSAPITDCHLSTPVCSAILIASHKLLHGCSGTAAAYLLLVLADPSCTLGGCLALRPVAEAQYLWGVCIPVLPTLDNQRPPLFRMCQCDVMSAQHGYVSGLGSLVGALPCGRLPGRMASSGLAPSWNRIFAFCAENAGGGCSAAQQRVRLSPCQTADLLQDIPAAPHADLPCICRFSRVAHLCLLIGCFVTVHRNLNRCESSATSELDFHGLHHMYACF